MATGPGDRFVRRHNAARTSTSNTTAADITYDTAVLSEGGYSWASPEVTVDESGLYLCVFDLGQVDLSGSDRAVGTLVPSVNTTDQTRFRATHRYLRNSGGAQEGASIGMCILDLTANDDVKVRNPGSLAPTDAVGSYATNASYGGGLQLVRLNAGNFTHVERTTGAAEVGTSNINTTRPWLDSSGTWTTITYNSEVNDDDALYPGTGGDLTLKANTKYMVVWGATITSTDSSRHTDVVRLQINSVNVQTGSGYQRNTASNGPPICGMYLHETGVSTETCRLQATHETEGGDAGTPTVEDAYLQVIELPSGAEWIHVDNGATNSLTTALAGTTTWYDTPLSSTFRADGDSNLSLDSVNDAVQNDSGGSLPVLAIGWHRWDRDTGSSGTRKNPWTRWDNGGAAVGYGVAGAYSRGQQSSDDTWQAHYTSAALLDLANGADLSFQVLDEASSANSDMGIYASTASNRHFLGVQVLNLDTLSAAAPQTLNNDFIASSNTVYEPTVSVSAAQQIDAGFISSGNTLYEPAYVRNVRCFEIQHIDDYDVPSTGGSQTITQVNMLSTLVLNTNNGMLSGGENGDTVTPGVEDACVGIQLTTATNIDFDRDADAVDTTRCSAAIIEYTGKAGGPNEFIVRGRGTINLTTAQRTNTTTCDSTPTDIDDCVVFVTGFVNSSAAVNEFQDVTCNAWLSSTDTINFERGGNTSTTTIYYTVVEFTGSNWTVHHGHSGDVTADTGSITLYDSQKGTGSTSTVSSWSDAFIYGLFKGDDTKGNSASTDLWPVYDPGTGTGTVDWTFDATHDAVDNQHLVYVIENSDTNFSVVRYNTGAITFAAGDITQTITAVASLDQSVVLCTAEENTTSGTFMRGYRNAGFNSTTQAYAWCHRANATGQVEFQVIEVDSMEDGFGDQTLTNDYIASSYTVYEPTVSPGAVTLTADYIGSSYAIYEPALTAGAVTLSADFIASTYQIYEPTLSPGAATLTADFISSSYQVFEPSLIPGAITLTSDYISTSYQIFEPTLASVTQLDVDFITSSYQIFEPVLTPGAVTLTGDYIVSSYQMFEPTLAPGAITLTSDFIASSYQTFEPTLVPGAVTVSNDFIASSYQIFEPTVNLLAAGQILADFIPSSYQIFEPSVTTVAALQIDSDFITSSYVTYEPNLIPGAITLSADFISSSYQIHEPTLTSEFTLGIDFISSSYQIYDPLVTTPQPQTLDSDFISSSYQIFEPNVTTPSLEVEQGATDDDKRYISDRALIAVELVYKEYMEIRRQRILDALSKLRQ